MKAFKLNTNKVVMKVNKSIIFPNVGVEGALPRSVNFTNDTLKKIMFLRAKYKISRSAIIRILVDAFYEESLKNEVD